MKFVSHWGLWQPLNRLGFSRETLCSLQEAYFRYMAENPTAGLTQEEEEENIDYDSDGNPIASTTKKIILPLPPIDHSEVQPFKNQSASPKHLSCKSYCSYIVCSFVFFSPD